MLSVEQKAIISYLNGKDFVSPTEIGNQVGGDLTGHFQHSAWASPKCLKLVSMGLLRRNKKGWYKIKSLTQK
jgi:hypothetical protein